MYYKNCKKHAGNTFPKKLVLISKNKTKWNSKSAIYLTERTFIYEAEDKYGLEGGLDIYLQLFTDWCYKRTWRLKSVKCRKNTENLNSKIFITKNCRLIMQLKCTECRFKKSRFVKQPKKPKVYWVI